MWSKKSTAALIKELGKYIRQTGYARPGIEQELRERAKRGDPLAKACFEY